MESGGSIWHYPGELRETSENLHHNRWFSGQRSEFRTSRMSHVNHMVVMFSNGKK
jgi:hypothetical protein